MRSASRSPGHRPDSTSSARSATAEPSCGGTRSAAIPTQRRAESASAASPSPSPGRRRPELGRLLGGLGGPVGRDRVVHQRGDHRGDGRPPPRRASCRGSAAPGSPAAVPAGTAWSGGRRGPRSSGSGRPGGPRRSPTARTGPMAGTAVTSSPSVRTNATGARRAYRPRPRRGRGSRRRPCPARRSRAPGRTPARPGRSRPAAGPTSSRCRGRAARASWRRSPPWSARAGARGRPAPATRLPARPRGSPGGPRWSSS